jgi:choline kinase
MIILAAGKGERLMPLTRSTPKPLLDLGSGKTLLEEQVERMRNSGVIDEIVLVTGYLAEQIDATLDQLRQTGVAIRTIHNPFYDISNNLMSLWFAKGEMDGPFMVTNGDNLFDAGVFKEFVAGCPSGIFLAVSAKAEFDDDDMKVTVTRGLLARVSKGIAASAATAESPGLFLVTGVAEAVRVRSELERLAYAAENRGVFWLELVNSLVASGCPVKPWEFQSHGRWQEIDIHLDVLKMKRLLGISVECSR